MNRRVIAAAAVAAALVVLALWWRGRTPASQPAAAPDTSLLPAETGVATEGRATAPISSPPAPPPRTRLTPAARADLEAALAQARARRTRSPVTRPALPEPAPTKLELRDRTGGQRDWERRQLGVLNELLGECYDLGRAEDPALAGTVMLLFTVSGEPEVGGLVSDVHFDEGGTSIAQPTMRECMQNALYALELDPPPEGISVSRQLTLELAPD